VDAFVIGSVFAMMTMSGSESLAIFTSAEAVYLAYPLPSNAGSVKYAISTSPLTGGPTNAPPPTTS
jgi:hypothetical protein